MYKVRSEIFKNILEPLLECHGSPINKISFYNKVQGYGLRATDFDKKKGCSRRVFSHWKDFLLERKIIRKPKIKRKLQDKTKDSDRNYPFVITPLGICRFSSSTDEIIGHMGGEIVEILRDYGMFVPNIDWNEICKIISANTANKILKQICDSVDLREVNDEFHIILNYRSRSGITYEKSRYIIRQNQVYVKLPEDMQTIESFENPKPVSMPKIDDDLLYSDIAKFIIESFCYSIIENYYWKIFNKSIMLNWPEISSKKKTEIKKDIETYKKTLDQIPFEVHYNANNFIGQNLFGSIKQEQKLLKKILDTFNSEIAPKNGFRFIDTKGNTMQLFPD